MCKMYSLYAEEEYCRCFISTKWIHEINQRRFVCGKCLSTKTYKMANNNFYISFKISIECPDELFHQIGD